MSAEEVTVHIVKEKDRKNFSMRYVDPFTGKSFVYRREGDGFIVYSLGVNRTDDGGVEDEKDRDKGDIVWRIER